MSLSPSKATISWGTLRESYHAFEIFQWRDLPLFAEFEIVGAFSCLAQIIAAEFTVYKELKVF